MPTHCQRSLAPPCCTVEWSCAHITASAFDSAQTAVSKSRCVKQTCFCLHVINSLNSSISLHYSWFKSIVQLDRSAAFSLTAMEITISLSINQQASLLAVGLLILKHKKGPCKQSCELNTENSSVTLKRLNVAMDGAASSLLWYLHVNTKHSSQHDPESKTSKTTIIIGFIRHQIFSASCMTITSWQL